MSTCKSKSALPVIFVDQLELVRRVSIIIFNNLSNLAMVQLISLQFCSNLNISFVTVVLLSTDDKGSVKMNKLGLMQNNKGLCFHKYLR